MLSEDNKIIEITFQEGELEALISTGAKANFERLAEIKTGEIRQAVIWFAYALGEINENLEDPRIDNYISAFMPYAIAELLASRDSLLIEDFFGASELNQVHRELFESGAFQLT